LSGAGAVSLGAIERALDPAVLDQLGAVQLVPGQPLVAVDADEVLVIFAAHLARYAARRGYEMRLTKYRLEGTFFHAGTERALDFDQSIRLINAFFEEETLSQQAVPGASEALGRLSRIAQIIVLTNVPRHARAMRIANLQALGMGYPLIENGGGKGRALAWLAVRAQAPAAFIDDSPHQLESAQRRAPDVARLHFVGLDYVARVLPDSPPGCMRVTGWSEAEQAIRTALALDPPAAAKS